MENLNNNISTLSCFILPFFYFSEKNVKMKCFLRCLYYFIFLFFELKIEKRKNDFIVINFLFFHYFGFNSKNGKMALLSCHPKCGFLGFGFFCFVLFFCF